MPGIDELRALLQRIDGANYGAYKQLRGRWSLGVRISVDHVQGDPFASPSRVRVRVPHSVDPELLDDADGTLAVEDWMLRRFAGGLHSTRRGSGRSGEIRIYTPGPEILERSAARVIGDDIELRIAVGLPARGRRILGREALALLTDDLEGACAALAPDDSLALHVASVRRQRALRRALTDQGLVAFIEDGAVLPRRSGVDPRPLDEAIPFRSPPSLRVTLDTPQGPVDGMGIGEGVTVIVGGGFHGKSTVLQAIQRGHLDHISGDGRSGVVALADAVKIRAEDGRSVEKVDISILLRELPNGRGTRPFSTEDASGSTSQAAALVEAVQAGARVLLMDEDTCATNLMVRDARIRTLVPREPITPLVERLRALHQGWGVSVVLVVGGVGDYLGVADRVLSMEDYVAHDRTVEARALEIPAPASEEALVAPLDRVIEGGLASGRIKGRDERRVLYGDQELELAGVEQILDAAQAWTIAQALSVIDAELIGDRTVAQTLDALEVLLDAEGVETLSPREYPDGGLVRPRRHEVAAALNRLRSLRIR